MVGTAWALLVTAGRVLLACLGVCPHADRYRERDDAGVLRLVCEQCGDAVPAITREAGWQPSGVLPAVVTRTRKRSDNVTTMQPHTRTRVRGAR
jgi:hypothetical protein